MLNVVYEVKDALDKDLPVHRTHTWLHIYTRTTVGCSLRPSPQWGTRPTMAALIPDGLGVYNNWDGTFTVVIAHA